MHLRLELARINQRNAPLSKCGQAYLPHCLVLLLDLVHEGVVAVELLLQAASVVLERRHGLQLVLHVQQPLQDVLVDLAEGGVVQGIP